LSRLQSIQNAAAHLILKIPKYDHISSDIRNELHWLPIIKRIDYKLCLFAQNCLTGTTPDYLIELCQLSSSIPSRRNLRSAERGDLFPPCYHTEFDRHGFFVAGQQLWNSLPPHVRQPLDNKEHLQKLLKTYSFGSTHQRL